MAIVSLKKNCKTSKVQALNQRESPSGVKSFEWAKGNALKAQTELWIQDLIRETDEVKASKEFKLWLDIQSKFPKYSFRNTILILLQCPDASIVGGARSFWIPKMHRYIKSDEWKNPIRILAPCFKKKADNTNTDKEEYIAYFRTVNIYEAKQTEGEAIPDPPSLDIEGDSLESWLNALKCFSRKKGIETVFEELRDGLFGQSRGNEISVNSNKSINTQVNTLLHEIAHELLHQPLRRARKPMPPEKIRELQAEAYAYIVGRAFGFRMKSPEYFALRRLNVKENSKCLREVVKATREVIVFIDHEI